MEPLRFGKIEYELIWSRLDPFQPQLVNLEVLGAARGSQSRFFETLSNGIIGQEFSSGSSGSTGNGVRSCGSDPAEHAQESQDDVSPPLRP